GRYPMELPGRANLIFSAARRGGWLETRTAMMTANVASHFCILFFISSPREDRFSEPGIDGTITATFTVSTKQKEVFAKLATPLRRSKDHVKVGALNKLIKDGLHADYRKIIHDQERRRRRISRVSGADDSGTGFVFDSPQGRAWRVHQNRNAEVCQARLQHVCD